MTLRHALVTLRLALATLLLLGGCGDDDAGSNSARSGDDDAVGEPEFVPIAGGVGWTAEEPLVWARPANDMRDAQYSVRDTPVVELTISHFDPDVGGGGDVDANVERWVGQFEPLESQERETRELNDLPVTLVDLRGTFVGRQGMGRGGPPRRGWRMRGAIVQGPEGLVFFKLLGPAAGVETGSDAFEALVDTIHPE